MATGRRTVSADEILRISDESDRAAIVRAIAALRAKQDRMPAHWTDRRVELGDEIDDLVDQWLAVGP